MSELLRIEGLSVPRGGRPVLHDVTLEVAPGEVTALLGPNGTGKSTLVLAVAGVLRATAGRVLLGDEDLTRRRPERIRRAGVAVVAEGRRLLPDLSVADNLRVATYSLEPRGRRERHGLRARAVPRAEGALGHRGAARSPAAQQQMVVLAQALASRPVGAARRRAVARAGAAGRQAARAHAGGGGRDRAWACC